MVLRPGKVSTVSSVLETQIETVAIDKSGQKIPNSDSVRQSIEVQLLDGTFTGMFMVLVGTVEDWRTIFKEYGIAYDARCNSILIVSEFV